MEINGDKRRKMEIKSNGIAFYLIFILLLFVASCNREDESMPQNLPPRAELTEAYGITRHEATVSGSVTPMGSGHICFIRFKYGEGSELVNKIEFETDNFDIVAHLTGLKTETEYRCVLETGNEYSTISSDTLVFSTAPGGAPVLSPVTAYCHGPYRIGLQSLITDDGGLPLTEMGFYYWPEGGEKKKQPKAEVQAPHIRGILRLLEKDRRYQAQAYAANREGESVSEPFAFTVSDSLTLTVAGTLADSLTAEEKRSFTSLTLKGDINANDFYLLNQMMGGEQADTLSGNLSRLDLTEVDVCTTVVSPWGYTKKDELISLFFKDCVSLEELKLPATVRSVYFYIFRGCTNLRRITFPRNLEHYGSDNMSRDLGLSHLEGFDIAADAPNFRSYDDAFYDKAGEKLIWYPPCRDTARADDFLPTMRVIASAAFSDTQLRYLELPKAVHTLKDQTNIIMEKLEYLSMPDSIRSFPLSSSSMHFPNLKTLYWGKGATRISSNIFYFPKALRQIYVPQSTPPDLTENYDGDIPEIADSCILYVPIGATAAYREAEIWKLFTHIVEMEFE